MPLIYLTTAQKRMRHISSELVSQWFGMEESLDDLSLRWLRWLGHTARMKNERLPKKVLFGWLPQGCPAHQAEMERRNVNIDA